MIPLLLASSSPRRKMLLTKYTIPFSIEISDYEEIMEKDVPYQKLAKMLAYGKAASVAKKHPNENVLILAADTFVVFEKTYFGKPKSREQAETMLMKLSGKVHTVITAFAVIHPQLGKEIIQAEESTIQFVKINKEIIKIHLDTHTYLDKAGGYALFETAHFVEKVTGDRENIIGLPVREVVKALSIIDNSYARFLHM